MRRAGSPSSAPRRISAISSSGGRSSTIRRADGGIPSVANRHRAPENPPDDLQAANWQNPADDCPRTDHLPVFAGERGSSRRTAIWCRCTAVPLYRCTAARRILSRMTDDDGRAWLEDHLRDLGVAYELVPCDPALADTAAFCAA